MDKNVNYKYHNEMGQFGLQKVCENIKRSYWFSEMTFKLTNHVRNCLKCISFSTASGKKEGSLYCITKGDIPFETLYVNHYGPVDR